MAEEGQQAEGPRIEGYLRGDAEVFKTVDAWIRIELRRRYPGLHQEHEDLCQVVHGKLFANLKEGRYLGRSDLRAYVTGIAHRTAIDWLRELYRARALSTALSAAPAPTWERPVGEDESRDEIRLIHQALLAMPPNCRELWRLLFVERLSYEEIARRLTIPEGTVKSRMWHCRRKAMATLRRLRFIHRIGRKPHAPS